MTANSSREFPAEQGVGLCPVHHRPEHGLVRTLGIENGGPISAIAVRNGTAYLPLDHNYVDPRPPLLSVTLD